MKIKAYEIVKIYDQKLPTELKALDKVSVEINQGEFIAIIGQTGSGKTTFIQHMNALLLPDQGRIEYFYFDTQNQEKKLVIKKPKFLKSKIKFINEIRRRVGVVFQFAEYQLFEQTIEKDIIFGAISMGASKAEAKKKAIEMIELVGLDKSFLEKSPFELSGGQKRRVAIAGILAMEPDIIFFDEPTAGLDPQGTVKMLEILDALHKKGKTIILATHDLDNVLEWTKRCIFFKDGKIIYDGPTYPILANNKFLIENNMLPTNLLNFREKLIKIGYPISDVKSVAELISEINFLIEKDKNAN
ncbi:ATP-binding cassette domain-containing protein [Mesomycoplasma flocculare]|uniref:Cobalt transporter ATP-binding subunit n=2 Tax=Mesomycoplasma flocculare TaxID=2128 RepID=A0A0A8E794_MESFC|nr:ATP-binding cassette domain-containing protein [Mesomycoplasma flocculare]AJC49893.1 cobalt transporter ATP-binding subunit [Mesomycoplasma flocculare ATCC 27399]ENX51228.1 ABC transporter ATP-binding protein [Mesomycoplasma flocculare ATCC 27716]MXR12372.1 ATP-binding cassette domain-containing protein [Mesomycoplasma flocculare]MXR13597.1 ATP-binding cassette domain-containing protein [Mesomycoplasma flocculare]MXR22996.1 ATP-binding cassette domain-containing protein [Mesomycoplasma floc